MPDLPVVFALLLLVALIDAMPLVRVPLGLVMAIALLASGADLLPIAAIGAVGVMVGRLALALAARIGRDRMFQPSAAAKARREQLRQQLASSPAFTRITFLLAALPGFPAGMLFPMLGAMRAPLWPALAGTVVGKVPVLAITTAIFAWVGRVLTTSDDDAAVLLAVGAVMLLVMRLASRVDWEYRAETGRFRFRGEDEGALRMTSWLGATGPGTAGNTPSWSSTPLDDDGDIVEGEVLGEEVVGDDDHPSGRSLPPTSGS